MDDTGKVYGTRCFGWSTLAAYGRQRFRCSGVCYAMGCAAAGLGRIVPGGFVALRCVAPVCAPETVPVKIGEPSGLYGTLSRTPLSHEGAGLGQTRSP